MALSVLTYKIPCEFGRWTFRTGAIVTQNGGIGELAPLPGFSLETLEEGLEAFESGHFSRFPSAQTAHDMMAVSPSYTTPSPIHVAGLLSPTLDWQDLKSLVKIAETNGYKTIKLKVSPKDLSKKNQLRSLCHDFPQIKLRLDGNRQFTLEESIDFFSNFSNIDYIEEPLIDSSDLKHFYEKTGLPIAMDETLRQSAIMGKSNWVTAWILKPTLSGLEACKALAKEASLAGKRAIWSSSFESVIGLSLIGHTAYECCPDETHGLDTLQFLSDPTLGAKPWSIKNPWIIPPIDVLRSYLC